MNLKWIGSILLLLAAAELQAQESIKSIEGRVLGELPEGTRPLPSANVFWAGTTMGVTTDEDGRFLISFPEQWPAGLVASYVGFRSDTVMLSSPPTAAVELKLRSSIELRAVDVVERQ